MVLVHLSIPQGTTAPACREAHISWLFRLRSILGLGTCSHRPTRWLLFRTTVAAPQHRLPQAHLLCNSRRRLLAEGLRLRRLVLTPCAANRLGRAALRIMLRPRSTADVRILEGVTQRRGRAGAAGCGWSGGVAVHTPRLVPYDVGHVDLAVNEL